MNTIKQQVREYLMETVTYGAPIDGDDTKLVESGFLDSFGSFDLAAFMEGAFNVEIPSVEISMENFGTLNKIETYILSKPARTEQVAA